MTEPMETHDIAVTVIVRATAVDHSDATSVAEAVVARTLRDHVDGDGNVTVQLTKGSILKARLLKIISVDRAARAGYLSVQPTGLAARERGLYRE